MTIIIYILAGAWASAATGFWIGERRRRINAECDVTATHYAYQRMRDALEFEATHSDFARRVLRRGTL